VKTKLLLRLASIVILLSVSSTFVAIGQAWYDSPYPWSQNQHDARHTGASESSAPSNNSTIWTYNTSSVDLRVRDVMVDGGRVFGIRRGSFFVLDETTGAFVLGGGAGGEYETNVGGAYAMGKIYYTSYDIYGQGTIYCYNATTGAQLWNYSSFGEIHHTPTLSGNRVYVGTINNYLYCIEDGVLKWNQELGGPIYSAPAVDNDLLCIGSNDGKLYAFNISGAQPVSIWNFTLGNSIMKPITIENDKVYFSGGDGSLYVLDKTNGQLIWSWKSKSDGEIELAVASGVVYVCTDIVQGGLYALYTNVTAGNYNYSSPEPLLWSDETADGSYGIAIAGDTLLYVDLNNVLHARNTLTGTNLWSFQFDYLATNPIVADGHVFVADQTQVYCIGTVYPIPEFTLPMIVLLCGIMTLTAIGLKIRGNWHKRFLSDF
jgi:outer membrane protein assembly factor BamB